MPTILDIRIAGLRFTCSRAITKKGATEYIHHTYRINGKVSSYNDWKAAKRAASERARDGIRQHGTIDK